MQSPSPGELATLAQRPVRVLVVDEDVQEQQILKLKLESLGAEVVQVRHGRMAIMTAQRMQPDIIILDLETTDMAGIEVLRHLKTVKRTSSIPVICISTSSEESFRQRALRLNADWFLSKPFRFSQMLARLRYLAQGVAASTSAPDGKNLEEMRRSMMRVSVDTISDIHDIRKALHGLKGYIGADDYYLNTKLEICFRSLLRIDGRLKTVRGMTTGQGSAGARVEPFPRDTGQWPSSADPFREPGRDDQDDGTHGSGGRRD